MGLNSSSSSCVSLRWLSKEFPAFLARRCSHFEIWRIISSWLRIWQSHVLCLGVAREILKNGSFGRFCGCSRATLGSTVDTCSASVRGFLDEMHTLSTSSWTRILRCFFLRSHAEWRRSVLSRCLRCLETGNSVHELHVAGRVGVGASAQALAHLHWSQ